MGAKISNIPTNLIHDVSTQSAYSLDNTYNPTTNTMTYTNLPAQAKDKNITTYYDIKGQATGGQAVNYTYQIDFGKVFYGCTVTIIMDVTSTGGTGVVNIKASPTDPTQGTAAGPYSGAAIGTSYYLCFLAAATQNLWFTATNATANSFVTITLREVILYGG